MPGAWRDIADMPDDRDAVAALSEGLKGRLADNREMPDNGPPMA